MENFTPVQATVGGMIIGLAAALLYIWLGKVAGISGILGNLLQPRGSSKDDRGWRATFLLGLIGGPFLWFALSGQSAPALATSLPDLPLLIIAGLLVGFGTRLGRGCTSGHGVCGMARFSARSITATVVFMVSAIITVAIMRHGLGG